jgi:hypothetical protein
MSSSFVAAPAVEVEALVTEAVTLAVEVLELSVWVEAVEDSIPKILV